MLVCVLAATAAAALAGLVAVTGGRRTPATPVTVPVQPAARPVAEWHISTQFPVERTVVAVAFGEVSLRAATAAIESLCEEKLDGYEDKSEATVVIRPRRGTPALSFDTVSTVESVPFDDSTEVNEITHSVLPPWLAPTSARHAH